MCRGVVENRWEQIALVMPAPGCCDRHLRPLKVGLFESFGGLHVALPGELRYVRFRITPYDEEVFRPGYEVDPMCRAVPLASLVYVSKYVASRYGQSCSRNQCFRSTHASTARHPATVAGRRTVEDDHDQGPGRSCKPNRASAARYRVCG